MMLDFSSGSFMLPLRIVQLVCSLIVLCCAIAGRVYLPNFASAIKSPEIMIVSGVVHVLTTVLLLLMFYVLKVGSKVSVVSLTVLFEFLNYGSSIASFVNMVHDFQFGEDKKGDVCALDDFVNNPNPVLGCNLYQASIGFSAFCWFLWTISMTWIISRIHKRVRTTQMARDKSVAGKDKEYINRADLESQGSTYASRNHLTNSPIEKYPGSF